MTEHEGFLEQRIRELAAAKRSQEEAAKTAVQIEKERQHELETRRHNMAEEARVHAAELASLLRQKGHKPEYVVPVKQTTTVTRRPIFGLGRPRPMTATSYVRTPVWVLRQWDDTYENEFRAECFRTEVLSHNGTGLTEDGKLIAFQKTRSMDEFTGWVAKDDWLIPMPYGKLPETNPCTEMLAEFGYHKMGDALLREAPLPQQEPLQPGQPPRFTRAPGFILPPREQ